MAQAGASGPMHQIPTSVAGPPASREREGSSAQSQAWERRPTSSCGGGPVRVFKGLRLTLGLCSGVEQDEVGRLGERWEGTGWVAELEFGICNRLEYGSTA